MAGLLDSKTRVLDAKLTLRGRTQVADGGIEIKYVSFSDAGATYSDAGDGVAEVPLPIGFECWSTSNDDITVSTDNFGNLEPFVGDGFTLRQDETLTSNGGFFSSGSLKSFENQRLISTRNSFFEDPGLTASPSEINFSVTDSAPFNGEPSASSIDDVESLFFDRRLSKSVRFQYLPPVQRTITTVGNEVPLGNYVDSRETPLTETEIESTLSTYQNQKITLSKYTSANEVCFQLFESSSTGMSKLDIVKYGELQEKTPDGLKRNLYFAGKVYTDAYGSPTFVNLFNLVIE